MQDHTTPTQLQARAFTLWRHLGEQDEASISYAIADRRVAGDETVPHAGLSRRATNWAEGIHRYEEFWRASGRTPRENTRNRANLPGAERRLGEWARYQRRFEQTLTTYQRIRLDLSPAFEWDPHESIWWQRRDACVEHVQRTGRLPHLSQVDPVEFALARWMGRQMRRLQNATLPPGRSSAFTALLAISDE